VQADEADDLQSGLSDIHRKQELTRAQLDQLLRQQARLRAVIDDLRGRLQAATATLEEVQGKVNALQAQIDEVAARAKAAEEAYRQRRVSFQTRARIIYKTGLKGWALDLVAAQSFEQFLQRAVYLQAVTSADARTARELGRERQRLDEQRAELQQARDALRPLQEELAARRAAVAAQYDIQTSYDDELERSRRASLHQLAGLQAQGRSLQQALDRWREQQAGLRAKAGGGTRYAAQCPAPPPAGSYRFCGHGWGHGVGMGQWGAYGMARAGNGYRAILTSFYPGTTLGSAPTASTPLHVALSVSGRYRVVGEGGPFHWSGHPQPAPPGASVDLTPGMRVDPDSPATRLKVYANGSPYHSYRGSMVNSNGRAINVVPVEEYLRGMGEVPSSWPLEAIKAQIVAARCYALTHLGAHGSFDVYDSTRDQVYGGADYETGPQSAAVDATRGEVAFWNGQVILAFYSSSDGGHTANVAEVWGSSIPYLRGVRDDFDGLAPLHTWYSEVYSVQTLEQIYFTPADLAAYGRLQRLDLSHRDSSNRLVAVGLLGTKGTKTMSADRFMAIFNSPDTTLTGRDALWSNLFGATPAASWPYW
jgi:SpoIID/LytB domain protein